MATPSENPIICFDLGGVLVQIRHSWADALAAVDLATQPSHQVHLNAFPELLVYQDGLIEEDEYSQKLGGFLGVTSDEAIKTHEAILIQDYPGALELVEELKSKSIVTACFSNTNALHRKKLISSEFHPAVAALDYKFASQEIGLAKPLIVAFQAVEGKMPPHSKVIFFDDSAENVAGANESGWQAFRVDPFDDPIQTMRLKLIELGVLAAG